MLCHFTLLWGAKFSFKDIVTQISIGFLNGIIFLFCDSVIPCIVLHLLLNTPNIVYEIKCYNRHFKNKKYYDELLKNSEEEFDFDF